MVLNLVSTTDEQTEALIGAIADGGFHVGTMVFGPQNPGRGVRSQRVFVRSDAAQLAGWSVASTNDSCASRSRTAGH